MRASSRLLCTLVVVYAVLASASERHRHRRLRAAPEVLQPRLQQTGQRAELIDITGTIVEEDLVIPEEFLSAEEGFTETWEHAKRGDITQLMKFKDFRGKYVVALLRKVAQQGVPNVLPRKLDGPYCADCQLVNLGSTNPMSDIDITVAGWESHQLVLGFNEAFFTAWGRSSSEVMDVNIYGLGWFANPQFFPRVSMGGNPETFLATPRCWGAVDVTDSGAGAAHQEITPLPTANSPDDLRRIEDGQNTFSLMKVLYYLEEIGGHVDHDRDCGIHEYEDIAPLRTACDLVSHFVDAMEVKLMSLAPYAIPASPTPQERTRKFNTMILVEYVRRQFSRAWYTLNKLMVLPCQRDAAGLCVAIGNGYHLFHMEPESLEANNPEHRDVKQARNTMYHFAVSQSLAVMRRNPNEPVQCSGLVSLISCAMFYGIETYWTKGAFAAIVMELQGKKTVAISPAERFDAAMENLGDAMKEYLHVAKQIWPEDAPISAVDSLLVAMSKYLSRLLAGITKLKTALNIPDSHPNPFIAHLATLQTALEGPERELSTKVRGKVVTSDTCGLMATQVGLVKAALNTYLSTEVDGQGGRVATADVGLQHVWLVLTDLGQEVMFLYYSTFALTPDDIAVLGERVRHTMPLVDDDDDAETAEHAARLADP